MDTLEILTHNKWKWFWDRILEFLFSPLGFYKLKYTVIVFPWSEVDRCCVHANDGVKCCAYVKYVNKPMTKRSEISGKALFCPS